MSKLGIRMSTEIVVLIVTTATGSLTHKPTLGSIWSGLRIKNPEVFPKIVCLGAVNGDTFGCAVSNAHQ